MREKNAGAGETLIALVGTGNQLAVMKFGAEADLVELLRFPGSAVACDCGASLGRPDLHPRHFGTFPRVLGRYVRETRTLTLEDAVRKMTGLPASILGAADRGFLAVGMIADIAVFDPATIGDRATYEQPTLLSQGVRLVLVNGIIALRDGNPTVEQAGRVLSRAGDMPSRPMRLRQTRTLRVKVGTSTGISSKPETPSRRAPGDSAIPMEGNFACSRPGCCRSTTGGRASRRGCARCQVQKSERRSSSSTEDTRSARGRRSAWRSRAARAGTSTSIPAITR